ncbi:MAG: DNA integrity scanning protein DisA nucleotide-binding domain protein [Proteobacteria bacterium]|nr:DNA integrity scanning protein DisA nucleotide-binding domain protein [Pseudomonadota bacterium]
MDIPLAHFQCILEVLDGLREGLSHFSQPSRAAVLYAFRPEDPLYVMDPQGLLRGHEPKLKELFLDSDKWRTDPPTPSGFQMLEELDDSAFLHPLVGLISFAGRSGSLFFQMWFTEHHPDTCCVGPTERWLEYGARLLSRNISPQHKVNLGTSGYVLQEYGMHAVRDYIVDRRNLLMGPDTRLRVFPILDAVLGISKTREEGAWPLGELVFVEPNAIKDTSLITRFPALEQPALVNFKHVRKLLLSVELSDRKLVSDGARIIGISEDAPPPGSIGADFRGSHGFVKLDGELICSFSGGRFQSSTRRANLVQVEEALLETDLDPSTRHELFQIVTALVHGAGDREHGCTLVINLTGRELEVSGHSLDTSLDLRRPDLLDLAQSLAKVDGALHIGADLKLRHFACLLDGHVVPGENRARGARFNSALRFTAEHSDLLVVVVSSDRPVSVIQGGIELTAQCEWKPVAGRLVSMPTLDEWIKG